MKKTKFVIAVSAIIMFMVGIPALAQENFPAGIHSMYIGEVVNAWKK
jgi:hypothetical protein